MSLPYTPYGQQMPQRNYFSAPFMGQGPQPPQQQPQQQPQQGAVAPDAAKGADPATLAAILQLQGMKPEQESIARQRKVADILRAQAQGNMQGQMVGQHYVAPGWGDLAGNLASNLMLSKMDANADERSKGLAKNESKVGRQLLKALTGKDIPEPEDATAGQPPSPGMLEAMKAWFGNLTGGGGASGG